MHFCYQNPLMSFSFTFSEFGCTKIGEQENFLNVTLLCTLKSPQFVPPDTRFDLLVLVSMHAP